VPAFPPLVALEDLSGQPVAAWRGSALSRMLPALLESLPRAEEAAISHASYARRRQRIETKQELLKTVPDSLRL
jgi:hypothetical protein